MINFETITYYVISAMAVLLTLTIHEYCHAYAAYKLGDPTARNLGRLTLNPIKHIDPIGALCMLFFNFGWAKPVPINTRYLNNPKRDFAIVALAGPASNIVIAFFTVPVYLSLFAIFKDVAFKGAFALAFVQNVLNLIPIPPLDGSRILNVVLPAKTYFAIMKYEKTIYYVLLGWLLLGERVVSFLLSIPLIAMNPILAAIVRIFSLSGILGSIMSFISSLIFNLWQLIPFLNV